MNIFGSIVIATVLIIEPVIAADVCSNQQCKCTPDRTNVNCDTKGWKNFDEIDFPPNVVVLTLVNNNLKFDTINDLEKIVNLHSLISLSLNQNPLGKIPSFNNTKIQFLSLQETSLTSVEFPSCYNNSFLQTISLSNNKIRSIKENDFKMLRNSKLKKLHIDDASISTIDQNAFAPLNQLQALSLKNNQLKTYEFLANLPLLSSIKLDGNQFSSLPQQLASPGNIKMYSFTYNSISIIDDSSPLYIWAKKNYTNNQIYLANNPFDCCLSLWFISFLKTSSRFIGDASLLTCATPSDYARKQLIKLNPCELNCSGVIPCPSWWTVGRIVGVVVGSISVIAIIIVIIIIVVIFSRQHRSRSGYTEIDGVDDPFPNVPPSPSGGPPFVIPEEDEDAFSISTNRSEAPTRNTGEGFYATDGSQAGDSHIYETALIPRDF